MTRRSPNTATPAAVIASTWRRLDEVPALLAWWTVLGAAVALGGTERVSPALALIVGAIAFIAGMRRTLEAFCHWRERAALAGRPLLFWTTERFLKRVKACPSHHVWFGLGFDWRPEHSQKLYELTKIDPSVLTPPAWSLRLLGRGTGKPADSIGWSALHGMDPHETDLTVAEKTLEGGTLIVGTTQAGKGVLMNLLVTQAIARGDTVIVLDPKNSRRLRDAVEAACRHAGRPAPYTFHPGEQSDGVRLNPLADYTRTSELASRITAVMDEEGPFAAFAWSAVHVIVGLLTVCGRTPTLAAVHAALTLGIDTLLEEALCRRWHPGAVEAARAEAGRRGLKGRAAFDFVLAQWEQTGQTDPAIADGIAVFRHDPEHYAKITASLVPVLTMLTSGALRDTLSGADVGATLRPMISLKTVLTRRQVLYAALDALPDPVVASALGAILLSDLAALAGERYNTRQTGERVCLFVDECSNVMNRPLIELLNKGAESGVRTTCAMQTVSDLAARLGGPDEARMALGNFNNVIALRTKDLVTQRFVTETFGRTAVANVDAALSASRTADDPLAFGVGYAERVTSRREETIPPDVLGKLPNCEFFASLAGGRLVKGRLPILITKEPS
ncbi:MAG: conjugative transfer system coupling protein TraD [Duodenibacillus sp.]|nr:conjugative transfer system coupling protein TraD [Duodenibacillus sp.]